VFLLRHGDDDNHDDHDDDRDGEQYRGNS